MSYVPRNLICIFEEAYRQNVHNYSGGSLKYLKFDHLAIGPEN